MPAPNNPPFVAGALTQPRQLQRWLDVNKVNKLTRTQTYWTLPAFSVEGNWLGYSNIVAVFNFTATNNFSLPLDYVVPSNPGYCPCIMWVDEDYNVYRYRLWRDVGEVMWFDAPVYSGQLIKSNFRIEIWSVAPVSYLSFTLFGAGIINANQEYAYSTATLWVGNGDTPELQATLPNPPTGPWQFVDSDFPDDVLYTCAVATFPFSGWAVGTGSEPAPSGASIAFTITAAADQTFITSVAGVYDYMWANDASIATAEPIVTNLSVPLNGNNAFTLPMEWPADSVPTLN